MCQSSRWRSANSSWTVRTDAKRDQGEGNEAPRSLSVCLSVVCARPTGYTNNYWTLSSQASLLAGFAFGQITNPVPEETPFLLECIYLLTTTVAMGFELCVVTNTTFCCMWGPGLALRGPHGARSVHIAVENLRAEQGLVFAFFLSGLLCFFASNLLLLW